MTAIPSPSQLAAIDNPQLDAWAVEWRARAAFGDRDAFGVAHALEVERRRRVHITQSNVLPERPAPVRPRWKFWQSDTSDGPMSPM
ncbi:hypothetical protein ACSFA8_26010 [Variovorax sp. RT4R15]|uniref:hypothetical protein n=1 Tax=Variovorax sp. RT4R15 TaxID=3443737 RepID=UPI003F48EB10